MLQPHAYAIQNDIRAAFKITPLRTFHSGHKSPYAIVGHNPSSGLITDVWFGAFDTDAQFRRVLEYICDLFEGGDYRLWLADLRYLNKSFFSNDAWLAEVVFLRAIIAGLEREAVVLPPSRNDPKDFDVFGSASSALRKIADQRVRGFHSLAEAKLWLLGNNQADFDF